MQTNVAKIQLILLLLPMLLFLSFWIENMKCIQMLLLMIVIMQIYLSFSISIWKMSSYHSPHDLLLLLPLQKSSSCNCQYKIVKNNNYYNKTNNNNIVDNNYYNVKNIKPENILLWILVVPLLISTTPTTTLIKPKQNSFITSEDPAKQTSSRTTTQLNKTTTTNIDVKVTKSLRLLLRNLTGSLIEQIIFKYLNKIQILLLHNLREVGLILDQIFNIRRLCYLSCLINSTSYITQTKILKESSSAAQFVIKPEEAFKYRSLSIKLNLSSQQIVHKRLLSIHTTAFSSSFIKGFRQKDNSSNCFQSFNNVTLIF